MVLVWILLIIIFLIVEALTFNLITIWFAIGALGAFITSYVTDNISLQVTFFALITLLSLILTRPLVKKWISVTPEKTNLDAAIGKTAIVIKKIDVNELGRVKVDGKEWTAKGEQLIKKGEKVIILRIEGVKLIVKKKEEK